MEVPQEILTTIADSLEAGLKCFIHRDTLEVVTYLDAERHMDVDPKDWKEEISKVKRNKKKFIEIQNMESSDSFRVMAQFAESVEDHTTRIRLITALEGYKPFANFKHQVDHSGEYREKWFAFRRKMTIEWIVDQLKIESL